MKIKITELRRITNALFDYLEHTGRTEVDITEDYYWSVPESQLYSVYEEPSELTLGQLLDDWKELKKIDAGQSPPIAYALVWLSALLRFIGARLIS